MLLLLSLGACTVHVRPSQIKCEPLTEFTCNVDCTQDETAFSFTLTSSANGDFTLLVTQPERLSGVSFLFTGGSYTVDANGMAVPFSADAFAAHSPVAMLFAGLQSFLFTGTETLVCTAEKTYESRQMIGEQLGIAVFSEDGKLLQLKFPDENTVYNFSYSENQDLQSAS